MATQTLIGFEKFLGLPPKDDVVSELDEGRITEMPPASFLHGVVQGRLFHVLARYLERTGEDFEVSVGAGFRLGPDTVRIPDVCLVSRSALSAMARGGGVLEGAPALAVEVVSPSDTAAGLDRKTEQCLEAGTASVWVIYPATRHVLVHRRSGETLKVSAGQQIQEPELLPGLALAVSELFAGIDDLPGER